MPEPNMTTPKEIKIAGRSFQKEDLIFTGILLILLWIFFTFRLNLKGIGFERDEGAYSYYGKLFLEGKIPYKDFYEQKFPGIFIFYAFMIKLFGYSVEALHKGFAWLNLASALLLFFAVRLWINRYSAMAAALAFGIYSMNPYISGYTIQSEHGVAFFTCLGFFFYILFRKSQKKKILHAFLSGLAFGCAFMTKTSGIMFLFWGGFVLFLEYFIFPYSRNFKKGFLYCLSYIAGAAVVISLTFLIIIIKGAFDDMIFWSVTIPKQYVSQVPWEQGKQFLGYYWKTISSFSGWFWNIPLITLPLLLFVKRSLQDKVFLILFGLLSFAAIVPGYYFYGHYWIQMAPAIGILNGMFVFGISQMAENLFKIKWPYIPHALLVVLGIVAFNHVQSKNKEFFGYYSSRANYNMILRQVYGENPFPECVEIARYLNTKMKPEDQLIVVGSEPQIYVYTNKKCPSRHAYFAAIVNSVPQHKEWQREYTADIEKAAPKYLVFFNHRISLLVQPNTDNYVFNWLNEYVNRHYHLIGLADMKSGLPTEYVYESALSQYRQSGQHQIYIYERN
ncbi:MAG: glycosyltransferase family 39 protein [Bacteroidia bacterium]|nr:glycosyltransferase family 39 protein [Bacteroidia bacterium]